MFTIVHNSINVLDLDKSLAFYKEALGMELGAKYVLGGGSSILAFLGGGTTTHQVELTWVRDRKEPYDLGDNESHLGITTDSFDSAYELHKKMGCICNDFATNGYYFITDPDGYRIEILRK